MSREQAPEKALLWVIYHPVKLVQKWSLNNLPNHEQFLRAFQEEDE